jgi:hypothetical protein
MTTKTITREVKAAQRGVMIYKVSLADAAPTVPLGPDSLQFSASKTGTGDYLMTLLDEASEEDLDVFIQSESAGISFLKGAASGSTVQILGFDDLAQTNAADGDFSLLVYKRSRSDKY